MLHNAATDLVNLLDAHAEAERFRARTEQWHRTPAAPDPDDDIQRLHQANFELWHLEDTARDPDATDSTIAGVKRSIDRANQRRNDTVERIDAALLAALKSHSLPATMAPQHSETPGMMLDRMSILALKIFHTAEQTERTDVAADHIRNSRERLATLQQQSSDLAECLAALWVDTLDGRRRFRLYRQLKMYNDPELNPVLYAASRRRSMRTS